MNKLQTQYNGKMPIRLDDFRWADAGYREGFYAFISAFGITEVKSFILSGCIFTEISATFPNTTYNYTQGYICFKGEVLKVNAGHITYNSEHFLPIFTLQVSYDPAGLKVFQDTTSHDTYEVRQAIVTQQAIISPFNFMGIDAKTLVQVISDKIFALPLPEDEWNYVGTTGNAPFVSGWSNESGPYELCAYSIDSFGNVALKGVASNISPIGVIFTLPEGYRIPFARYFPCYLGSAVVVICVTPNGNVSVYGLNTIQTIDLSSINYKI